VSVLLVTVLVAIGSVAGGLLGSLTGLGGGIIIVPMLTLLFGVDIRYAIGASLVSIIATSSGAAAAYVREGYTNIRVGMLLEIATTIGAILGALIAGHVSTSVVAVVFAIIMLISALNAQRATSERVPPELSDPLAVKLKLPSDYPSSGGKLTYGVQHVAAGFGIMGIAGVLSGLLGIGSGIVKVVAMDQGMKLPFKVSTTTSNFMIGVTAAASAGVYLHRGYIHPVVAMPVMLGVLSGALLGARILPKAPTRHLRTIFKALLVVMAVQMLYKGLTGGFR
jgi:uncharacterized membrane protein YfcA